MSDWAFLLEQALLCIDELHAKGTPVRWWSLGGGTALMLHLRHRDSRDIDIFVPDPQYLGLVSPRLSENPLWHPASYDETSFYTKLHYPQGEIDFIAASAVSDLPNELYVFGDRPIPLENPAEIILKKIAYRSALFKPRDIFDMAVVLASPYADVLRNHMELVMDSVPALRRRLQTLPPPYFMAAMEELAICDEWRHIIPTARQSFWNCWIRRQKDFDGCVALPV